MIISPLPFSAEGAKIFSGILQLPHVFDRLDPQFHSIYGLWELITKSISGVNTAYVASDEESNRVLGVGWCELGEEKVAHINCARGVNGVEASYKLLERFFADHPEIPSVVCYIPPNNRAIRLMLKRSGWKYIGKKEIGGVENLIFEYANKLK